MKSVKMFEEKIGAALQSNSLDELRILVEAYSEYVNLHMNAVDHSVIMSQEDKEE